MASTYYDSAGKEVIANDIAYASDLNDINTAIDSAFQQVETDITTLGANQTYYSDLAEAWAVNPIGVEVELGKYSAYHYSTLTAQDAISTAADAVQTAADRVVTTSDRGITTTNKNLTAADAASTAADRAYIAANFDPVPIGTIVAWIGGYFTNGSNAGFTSVLGNTVANVSLYLNTYGWYVCNGAAVNNAGSLIWVGANRYLPNLTDSRFIQGFTSAGSIGGGNANSHTHTTGNLALTLDQIPSHNHGYITANFTSTPGTDGSGWASTARSQTTDPVGGGAVHNHGVTGSSSVSENRPLFLSCFYIVRVF